MSHTGTYVSRPEGVKGQMQNLIGKVLILTKDVVMQILHA